MQTLKFNVGERLSVELSGMDPREFWPAAAFWLSLPTACPICAASLVLEYTTPKTYKYFKLKCTGAPPHAVNLGQKVEDGSLYFDRSKTWEIFRPGMNEDDQAAAAESAAAPQHANAPTGDKGKLIETIREQLNACHIRNIHEATKVDANKLGGQSVAELERCSQYLHGLLNKQPPPPAATPIRSAPAINPDDDIPF